MNQSSSLTPAMARIGLDNTKYTSALSLGTLTKFFKSVSSNKFSVYLRTLIQGLLDKNLYDSAKFIAEVLLKQPSITVSDEILFARCFFSAGEYRRCLATLEHRGLLSAKFLQDLSELLKPTPQEYHPNRTQDVYQKALQTLDAILLAAQCLFAIEHFDDCLSLVEPLLFLEDDAVCKAAIQHYRLVLTTDHAKTSSLAGIYDIAGRCYDLLENRPRAARALFAAARIDMKHMAATEYAVSHSLLSGEEKEGWYRELLVTHDSRCSWLLPYYRYILELDELDAEDMMPLGSELTEDQRLEPKILVDLQDEGLDGAAQVPSLSMTTADRAIVEAPVAVPGALVRRARRMFEGGQTEEAYRLARQAYMMDPSDWAGIEVYVGSMTDLGLKTELFYLGHELSNAYPKSAVAWYTVGCYYWCCVNGSHQGSQSLSKVDQALKYFQKATKIDNKFVKAWVALGHVYAYQEESEHAIAAYRNASRLAPGDHKPLLYTGKELIRTGNLLLALHVLESAHVLAPEDPYTLNEIGVVNLKQNRPIQALSYFEKASIALGGMKVVVGESNDHKEGAATSKYKQGKFKIEILGNLGTCLRLLGRLEEALDCYQRCLAVDHSDSVTHAHLGFTLHLLQRFEEAISCYHKALSLMEVKIKSGISSSGKKSAQGRGGGGTSSTSMTVCTELLDRALNDWSLARLDGWTGRSKGIPSQIDVNDLPYSNDPFEDPDSTQQEISESSFVSSEAVRHGFESEDGLGTSMRISPLPSDADEQDPNSSPLLSNNSNKNLAWKQLPWLQNSGDVPRPRVSRAWNANTTSASGNSVTSAIGLPTSTHQRPEFEVGAVVSALGISAVMSEHSSNSLFIPSVRNTADFSPSFSRLDESHSDDESYSRVVGRLSWTP